MTTLLVLASCANDDPQNALDPEGKWARREHTLWLRSYWSAVAVFALVMLFLIVAMVKFRAREGNERPVQSHGNRMVELGSIILSAGLLLGLGIPSVKTILDLADEPSGSPLRVVVRGHQFWWEYVYLKDGTTKDVAKSIDEHPEAVDFVSANELVIPVREDVATYITSVDVAHSFWVPRIAGKQDAIPGRSTLLKLNADTPNQRYMGQCAEYCGLSHANMRLIVETKTRAEFDAWRAAQRKVPAKPTAGDAAAGYALFTGPAGCAGCHQSEGWSKDGAKDGPNMTHLYSRQTYAGSLFQLADQQQLIDWIHAAPDEKPGVVMRNYSSPSGQLSDEQLKQLVAYLQTRK